MRIAVLAIGTRGDVQPLLALAAGLQQTGRHSVGFIAPDDFGALAREHGLDFSPFPSARTRAFPNVAFPDLRLGGRYNLWTYTLAERFMQQFTGRFLNRWRERFDLPTISLSAWPYDRLRGRPVPVLFSFSPGVVPRPPEWGEHIHVTGYWFLEHPPDWQPPADLLAFIESGPPPVYVGFGSMNSRDAQATTRLVLDALEQAGQRGILSTGWGALSDVDMPDSVFAIESIPHAWLFPRMAAVVHHGGAGTTGAGLRAGVPSILVPFAGDQPFWGERVKALGVGPAPIPRRRLTARRLADAVCAAVTGAAMRERAKAMGERIRSEAGVARAIEVIEGSSGSTNN